MGNSHEQINQRLVQGLAESDIRAQIESRKVFLLDRIETATEMLRENGNSGVLDRLDFDPSRAEEDVVNDATARLEQLEAEPAIGPAEIAGNCNMRQLTRHIQQGRMLGWLSVSGEVQLPAFQFEPHLAARSDALEVNEIVTKVVPAFRAFSWWLSPGENQRVPRGILTGSYKGSVTRSDLFRYAKKLTESRISTLDL